MTAGQLALLTPAGEIDTSSRWCQRWSGGVQSWTLAREDEWLGRGWFDSYTVERITRDVAGAYVVANHYSRSHVACRRSFGLFRAGRLVGVASYCVSSEAALRLVFPELKPGDESLELGRLVLADSEPGNTESWFIARCHEALHAKDVAGIVSFADPVPRATADGSILFPGHVGFIYQASNFTLAGRSAKRTQWMLPDGTFLNGVTMQKIRGQKRGHEAAEKMLMSLGARPIRAGQKPADWLQQARHDIGIRLLRHRGCHRYFTALGRNQRQRNQVAIGDSIRALVGAYPKQPDLLAAA